MINRRVVAFVIHDAGKQLDRLTIIVNHQSQENGTVCATQAVLQCH